MDAPLPVDTALPALRAALAGNSCAVLQAPPGAGKTTRVPLALLDEAWLVAQDMVMLEPRRLAARTAARFMAASLDEEPGATVGYRVRFDTRVSARTRIQVVTEGVLGRRLLADPELAGTGLLIFDEFHERNLEGDLGLALAREVQRALRPDLKLLVMSATLEAERAAALLGDAPVVRCAGRSHPVTVRHGLRPPRERLEAAMAETVVAALAQDHGSILAFLPGEAEIRRVADRLAAAALPDDVAIRPLYAALPVAAQDQAVRPAPAGQRKVVLATTIAETSLTIDGIGVVVDSGLKRVPQFDPRSGMSRLATVAVSRAAAEQRTGRAGRLGPGVCHRLWSAAEERGLAPHDTPEMLQADLAPLALTLADWGCRDPAALDWLDPPPPGAWAQALELLRRLEAVDAGGRITTQGRAMAALPLHPRLARMVQACAGGPDGPLACRLAALLSERVDGTLRQEADLRTHLEGLAAGAGRRGTANLNRAVAQIARAAGIRDGSARPAAAGRVLALAYPDRVAMRRGADGRYLVSGGGGARLAAGDPLAAHSFLAVAGLGGARGDDRIRLAAPLEEAELEALFASQIVSREAVAWSPRVRRVVASRDRRFGALTLSRQPLAEPPPAAVQAAMLDGLRELGLGALPWTPALRQWQQRVLLLRRARPDDGWPEVGDAALTAMLEQWLGPYLTGITGADGLAGLPLERALQGLLSQGLHGRLGELAPARLVLPSGRDATLDYRADQGPVLRLRLQQAFGMTASPAIAGGRVPVLLELLSPADRPLALTADLSSFWANVYPGVRKEMRGRYPKHHWPEDPATAAPPPSGRSGRR